MKNIELLIELGTEEIPADYIKNAMNQLEDLFKKSLIEYRLQKSEHDLILNSIFIANNEDSIIRSIGFIRFIIFKHIL